MKTVNEIKKLNGFEYISEISKNILFGIEIKDFGIEIKDFGKWTKLELLTFYRDWKHYDTFDEDGVYKLTMKSTEHQMRKIVGGILRNMFRKEVFYDGGTDNIHRKDILDYITTKRREKIINELIN